MFGFRLTKNTYGPIGLDIGNSSIRMVQIGVKGGRCSVIAAGSVFIEDKLPDQPDERGEYLISTIGDLLASAPFKGKEVVTSLPNDNVKITSVKLNQDEIAEPEEALWAEAHERFGVNAEKDTINYVTAGSVRHGTDVRYEVILFAAENEYLNRHVQLIESAGLRPVAIDTVPTALLRNFEFSYRRRDDQDHTVVFIDIGHQCTTVVFACEDELRLVKKISIGGRRFHEEIATRLGISYAEACQLRDNLLRQGDGPGQGQVDPATSRVVNDAVRMVAEQLAREVSLCFKYYTVMFKGKRVGQTLLSGGESYDKVVVHALKRQLGGDIELAEPFRGLRIDDQARFDSAAAVCEWSVAVGLGLKGWQNFIK